MTDQEARDLSRLIARPDVLPALKTQLKQQLLGYYKDLLASTLVVEVPAVRRIR